MRKLPQSLAGTNPALCALRGRTGEDGAIPLGPLPAASPPSGAYMKDAMPGLWIRRRHGASRPVEPCCITSRLNTGQWRKCPRRRRDRSTHGRPTPFNNTRSGAGGTTARLPSGSEMKGGNWRGWHGRNDGRSASSAENTTRSHPVGNVWDPAIPTSIAPLDCLSSRPCIAAAQSGGGRLQEQPGTDVSWLGR